MRPSAWRRERAWVGGRTRHSSGRAVADAGAQRAAGSRHGLRESGFVGGGGRRGIKDTHDLALARNIDLGLDAAPGLYIQGNREALRTLARNLVDNAVRYTPPGGTVQVRCRSVAHGRAPRGQRHGSRHCRAGSRADFRSFLSTRRSTGRRHGTRAWPSSRPLPSATERASTSARRPAEACRLP